MIRGNRSTEVNTNKFHEIEKRKREVGFEVLGKITEAIESAPPVKAESAESVRSKQDFTPEDLKKENQSKMLHSSTSRESVRLKPTVNFNEQERSPLPKIKPLKLQYKRRSMWLIEISIQQKLNLQKILKENHPLYAIGDAFWSTHWLETRSLLLLNQSKQRSDDSAQNGSYDSAQYEPDDSTLDALIIERKSNETEMELPAEETEDTVSDLSLEDRLLLIEQMHGLKH